MGILIKYSYVERIGGEHMPVAARKNTISEGESPISSVKYNEEMDNVYFSLNKAMSFFSGESAPDEPMLNQYWLDTASDPAVLRRYDGSVWLWTGIHFGTTVPLNPISGAFFINSDAGTMAFWDGAEWQSLPGTAIGFDPGDTDLVSTNLEDALKEMYVSYLDTLAQAEIAVTAAGQASGYATAADEARAAAVTAQGLAEGAETGAVAAQEFAELAQGFAEDAQTDAETARDKAEDWAEEAEDTEVEAGKYSAKHHALKAGASAAAASSSETMAAKWAEEDEDIPVVTGEYSAKHWAKKAEGNATVGPSAYDLAVQEGYSGTLEEWVLSLNGDNGLSAYEIAVVNGFEGDDEAWLESLKVKGDTGDGVPPIAEGDAGKLVAVKGDESGYETVAPYTLPTASADTLGGVKVGANLNIADGVLSAEAGGVSSWDDLTDKPESFAPSAHALDAHTAVTLAELSAKVSDKDIASTDAATTSAAGLMSASDKVKVDGVPVPVEGDAGKAIVVDESLAFALGTVSGGSDLLGTAVYARSEPFARDSANTLATPPAKVEVDGALLSFAAGTIGLNTAGNWDASTYATPANRAGKDFYVYATADGLILSANATYPTGYPAANSRKIGGFHCLCVAVGTISGHPLSGMAAGDILPASVWDLQHRPQCSPEGMVWSEAAGIWVDIYLQSGTGTSTKSANGGTITDTRNWMDFVDDLGAVGKRLLDDGEFQKIAAGGNEETNIAGSADPGTTTGHTDTAGRRMISNIGCEDCAGVVYQWLLDQSYRVGTGAAWNWYDLPGAKGSLYNYSTAGDADVKLLAGGHWYHGTSCGSRCRRADIRRWYVSSTFSARGCCGAM